MSGKDGTSIWNTQNRLFQRIAHAVIMRLCLGAPPNPCRDALDQLASSSAGHCSASDDVVSASSRGVRASAAKQRALSKIVRLQEQFAAISLGQTAAAAPTPTAAPPTTRPSEAHMDSDEENALDKSQDVADDCCIVCREQGSSLAPLGRICHMQQSSVLAYSCLTSQEREASVRALSETSIHNSAAVYFRTLQDPQFEAVAASSSAAASVLAVACTGWSIPPPADGEPPLPAPIGMFVSGCGHLMHFKCFRTRMAARDTSCPLCAAPISGILPVPSARPTASKRRSSSGAAITGAAADDQANSKRKESNEASSSVRRLSGQLSSALSSIFTYPWSAGGGADGGSHGAVASPEWDMVEDFNRGIERRMAPDGQHCLFPNVMPWSHILHAAAYTIIATEVGCRVHDVDWDSNTGECLIVAGAAGGLCKTLSSSRQLLHLKCVTSACRSRCDIPVIEAYSYTLLHQLQTLVEAPPLGIDNLETAQIVDSVLGCDTCSVLVHTLLLLPLDVPSTVSVLVRQTTVLLHRATLIQSVVAVLRDASASTAAASRVMHAAARVCAAADSGVSGCRSNSGEITGWAHFLLSFARSVFGNDESPSSSHDADIDIRTARAAAPLQGLSDEEVVEWSMSSVYARMLQFLRVALTCRVLLLGDAGMMLDNAGLGNGITMLLYGQQLSHLLQLPQLHATPPLTDTETRWIAKCRALVIPARAPARMMLPSLHRLPEKFELMLLETSSHSCRYASRCFETLVFFFCVAFDACNCSKSGKVANEPAVCLLCGCWLCAGHNRCCFDMNARIGAVTGKALSCIALYSVGYSPP